MNANWLYIEKTRLNNALKIQKLIKKLSFVLRDIKME